MDLDPLFDLSGQVDSLVAFLRDETQGRATEQALEDSEEQYRNLVHHSPYCIHEINRDGKLTSMNPAGLQMMGVKDEAEIKEALYNSYSSIRDVFRHYYLMD